jgi:hypothetical protein
MMTEMMGDLVDSEDPNDSVDEQTISTNAAAEDVSEKSSVRETKLKNERKVSPTTGKALSPAEQKKAEEEAAHKNHALAVMQGTAVTKMSTRLLSRRRALSRVEEQTNWIAKAVFSAASRKGPLTLNLLGCNVNNSAAIRLATTLATSDIRVLNLTFNHIGDVGAKAIARALKATPALAELGLGSNLITDHGAIDLATTLKDERSCLTFLNLSGNMIGDRGATALGVSWGILAALFVTTSSTDVC